MMEITGIMGNGNNGITRIMGIAGITVWGTEDQKLTKSSIATPSLRDKKKGHPKRKPCGNKKKGAHNTT